MNRNRRDLHDGSCTESFILLWGASERARVELAVVELGVEAVFRKQRFMVALLYDVTVAHDKDNIRFLDGR